MDKAFAFAGIFGTCHLWGIYSYEFFLFIVTTFEGIDVKQLDKCIGDPDADVDNQVLKSEQEAQVLI